MKRTLVLIAAMLLPLTAVAQTYTASLSGDNVVGGGADDGAGLAVVTFNGTDVSYTILVSGTDAPTAAHIHEGAAGQSGGVVINFNASFTAGNATGTVSADAAAVSAILSNPAGYYVNVHTGTFPDGAVRGQLSSGSGGQVETVLYFPVVASIAGQAGTDFHTDARLVNRSGDIATAELCYWPESTGGNQSPASCSTQPIAPNEQLVLDDMATELFGVTNGKGAVSISSDRAIFGSARVYNDQIAAGDGTFGQYVRAVSMDDAATSGAVEFLSNEPTGSGTGFRSNIGLFNPNTSAAQVTLYGWDADGTLLGSTQRTIGRTTMQQFRVDQLWPALADYGSHYVTFTAAMPIFVYGSVVDNVNGDAVYVPATAAN